MLSLILGTVHFEARPPSLSTNSMLSNDRVLRGRQKIGGVTEVFSLLQ